MNKVNSPYTIIDNFLPIEQFLSIKQYLESPFMPWFFMQGVASSNDKSDSYFTHIFHKDFLPSGNYQIIEPILNKIQCNALIRAKANLYLKKDVLIEHDSHTDFEYSHKAFILYINSNDGFTRLNDGTCIESVENRGLFFDGSILHNSSNCTNTPCRINISINYF